MLIRDFGRTRGALYEIKQTPGQNATKPNYVFNDAALVVVFGLRSKTAPSDFSHRSTGWRSCVERELSGLVFLARHCSLTLNQASLIPTSPYLFEAQTTVQGIEQLAVVDINGEHGIFIPSDVTR